MSQHIDIGVNLTNSSLMQDLTGVLARSKAANVNQLVVTGTTLKESEEAIELCIVHPQQLVCTAGIHPHHADTWQDDTLDKLRFLANAPQVRAVGETGLDFNRDFSPRDLQVDAFHQQLSLACELDKPVFTHQRDAHEAFNEILREHRGRLKQVVVHCFTGTKAALHDYLDLDCHIGITGWICDERRGLELQQLVKYIPANRLMAETDAPYLLPRDLSPKPRNRINEPSHLPHIIKRIAYFQNRELRQ